MSVLMGLSGWAGAGKDTFADFLVEDFGFTKLSFAAPLKEAVYRLNPDIECGETVPFDCGTWPFSFVIDRLGWDEAKRSIPVVRELLQRMGTEVGRELFGQDFWVDQAMRDLPERAVLSDVRFPNELAAIKDRHGFTVRIHRPGVAPANDHPSERKLDTEHFDFVVHNDGQINDLHTQVHMVLEHILGLAPSTIHS